MRQEETNRNYSNTELGIKERGKCKFPADFSYADYYKFYKENLNYAELPLGGNANKSVYNVKSNIYGKVLMSIFRKAREKMILTNSEYPLPSKMGNLSIQKIKKRYSIDEDGNIINKVPIDYKATRELWATDEEAKKLKKKVYLFNSHTDGYLIKIMWVKHQCNMNKRSCYKFTAVREFQRQIPKLLKENPNLDFYIFNK